MNHFEELSELVIEKAAERLGAKPAIDIPGLWVADGYPELTTQQLVSIAFADYTRLRDETPPRSPPIARKR